MAPRLACSIDEVRILSPAAVKGMLDSSGDGARTLLDVREPEEYGRGHIPGARLIPLGELEQRHEELDRDKGIIAYCRSGRRSLGASVLLRGLGFNEVYNMGGGMLEWRYETVTGSPEVGLEMVVSVVEPREALFLASRLEKGCWEFYAGVGERLKGKSQILPRLLAREEMHMKWIYAELARHSEGDLPALEELQRRLNGSQDEAAVTVNESLLRFAGDPRDDLEVIEAAIEMECKAYDLYKRMECAVSHSKVAALFQKLAAEERGHIQQLSGELKHFL